MSSLEIPETCGAMLLPDCTLFPHGGLPLRIFEERYRKMLSDSLAGSCFFAIARLVGEETGNPVECVSPVGTIGLVRASREMEDGTSNLLLHGVIRVHFVEWLEGADYPTARIRPIPQIFEPESQTEGALEALREAAEYATAGLPGEVKDAFDAMAAGIDDPAILADVLSQQFIHEPDDRYELLSMESVAARIAWLCSRLNP
ncbi:LON peptidase substrate-binding domain-containing protein [Haloferula sp. A504]|uniref:LON peptidase substrate-binding domain-containing protein n=1 Tax=Haloferula sp. A504 TaxID=3373601 RepID=UPI0031C46873|nr:LON peptidase substrate-binding domain-containing protein [Verrucomicrobiaceae bacterium E54]